MSAFECLETPTEGLGPNADVVADVTPGYWKVNDIAAVDATEAIRPASEFQKD